MPGDCSSSGGVSMREQGKAATLRYLYITECKLRGFRVPEDISVVGFDDIPISSMLEPPLTTIRQERSELGKCAYVILNSLVHHIPICRTQLRATLIERESTARYQAPVKKK